MPKYAIWGVLAPLLWLAYATVVSLLERLKDSAKDRTDRAADEWRAKQWRGWIED